MRKTAWVSIPLLLAAALVGLAGPAYAVASVDGYVWASQPAAASYLASTGYEYNSTGGQIGVTRLGSGDYRVRFYGMGVTGGVAHAGAYGSGNGGYCTVVNWVSSGGDEQVRVRCFDGLGAPADMRFVATFTNRQPVAEPFMYAWASQPTPPAPYVASSTYSYDSTGGSVTIERLALGQYRVFSDAIEEITDAGYYDGYFRTTAYGSAPTKCAVMEPDAGPPAFVHVNCFTVGAYNPVDSRFSISAGHGVNILGMTPSHASAVVWPEPDGTPEVQGWSSPGGAPTATEIAEGVYVVSFPAMGTPRGLAMVNAFGIVPAYCNVASWWQSLGAENIRVNCYTPPPGVEPTVAFFSVAFTT